LNFACISYHSLATGVACLYSIEYPGRFFKKELKVLNQAQRPGPFESPVRALYLSLTRENETPVVRATTVAPAF